jgi:hypothetical protein
MGIGSGTDPGPTGTPMPGTGVGGGSLTGTLKAGMLKTSSAGKGTASSDGDSFPPCTRRAIHLKDRDTP